MSSGGQERWRRPVAFAIDWLVITGWGASVFGVVMLATGGVAPRIGDPWTGEAVGFLTMTLPVLIGFSIFESSRLRATPGKRLVGLRVSAAGGGDAPIRFGQALCRNGIKFAPWECGHLVAQQLHFGGEAGALRSLGRRARAAESVS